MTQMMSNSSLKLLTVTNRRLDTVILINQEHVSILLCLVLATCSDDKRIGFIDAEGKVVHKIRKAHENPINRVKFANEQILMSGDDDGVIKVWDLRSSECVFECH